MPAVDRATLIAEIHRIFNKAREDGLEVWLIGGWAIEAQVPAAGRAHEDVDVAVALRDMGGFTALLEELGYTFPPDRQSPLRPEARRGEIVVQGAALKFGPRLVLMSVAGDAWLRCMREWFPAKNDCALGELLMRCARPEALLVSKLSSPWPNLGLIKTIVYQDDTRHLVKHLAPGSAEEVLYERLAQVTTDCDLLGCCPWNEPRFEG